MIPLIRLKKEVQFNVDLTRIVDALKGIAAARFHMLERQLKISDRYQKATETILSNVDFSRASRSFAESKSGATGVVMVTSTAGFLGGLNARVVANGLQQAG
ncbi:MAG: F0F1 ATP synthase subunit gamma, partial [Candidatus Omnitrophica bacterium]|nr:F0F1 ATP synthase subunit gamma [Candidatus Omnitrophota bacterium]